eukprot:gnl/TRDRNA2_/TRDRNA2_166397_c1_seq5.p1 gnl/TRDRNA2_/TRDRNA2_166397_c1~~gnl/TRDRNA2_/TRDRNA2_166397_c1_seq5.p1  ORF type:complete len:558 (-),score=66.94 gnl/TRDRNA2_/TRDRNA2_166397_c1_seq5:71-1744(-)
MASIRGGFMACCFLVLCAGSSALQEGMTLRTPGDSLAESEHWQTGVKTVPLRRERVSVYNKGVHVSYRTTYSGEMTIGDPAQHFRVLFDTGSNHVIVPSTKCSSESCVLHSQYDMSMSHSVVQVDQRSRVVPTTEKPPKTDIYFGTGKIQGELVREHVCTGDLCMRMDIVHAVDMSVQPFKSFAFDGIVGLGPVMHEFGDRFSFLLMMQAYGAPKPQFSMYLTENENGEESEISFGGSLQSRYKGSLQWVPTIMPEHGHWLIRVKAFKVNGVTIGDCEKCNFETNENCCHGIVDTGTSHLGIPSEYHKEVKTLLTLPYTPAANGMYGDCRDMDGPKVEFEFFQNFSIDVHPETYVRRIPLAVGNDFLKSKGISMAGIPGSGVPAPDAPTSGSPSTAPEPNSRDEPVALLQTDVMKKANESASTDLSTAVTTDTAGSQPLECSSRIMSVDLPAPLGPHLFLLGEPVVQRYYTVYDWGNSQIGFAEAVNRGNALRNAKEHLLSVDDAVVLMQVELKVHTRRGRSSSNGRALPAPVSSSTDPCSEPVEELSILLELDLVL